MDQMIIIKYGKIIMQQEGTEREFLNEAQHFFLFSKKRKKTRMH